LIYPPDVELFLNFLTNLTSDAVNFIQTLLDDLKPNIEFHDGDKSIVLAAKAGKTDFKLKK